MTGLSLLPWIVAALPCVGAAVSLLFWSDAERLRAAALVVTGTSLLVNAGAAWWQSDLPGSALFLCLLPLTAFISLLGQPIHRDNRTAWVLTLLLLGLTLGSLVASESARQLVRIGLLAVVALGIRRFGSAAPTMLRGLVSYGVGMAAGAAALLIPGGAGMVAGLVASGTLLPLLPLHAGQIATLTALPGNLPAFLALALPVVGFHQLLPLLPDLDPSLLGTVQVLGLAGALYGSLRSLTLVRTLPLLAYGSLAFTSLLWWVIGTTGSVGPQSAVYLSACGLAMTGLLLAWYAVRVRYGDIDPRALGGMAYPMPRFSTLFVLLTLAALGMPPFGVFTGFMGLLFDPTFSVGASFFLIILAWLSASWYLLAPLQQLVFGPQRSGIPYADLRNHEVASLVIVLLLLLVLGTAPARVFGWSVAPASPNIAMKGAAWTR
ncbi:MAG: hypothetical protein KF814_11345 [Nitrospiraceae bacterium]|nr:hypothetical protein [Nitrospiraceae bacterium]